MKAFTDSQLLKKLCDEQTVQLQLAIDALKDQKTLSYIKSVDSTFDAVELIERFEKDIANLRRVGESSALNNDQYNRKALDLIGKNKLTFNAFVGFVPGVKDVLDNGLNTGMIPGTIAKYHEEYPKYRVAMDSIFEEISRIPSLTPEDILLDRINQKPSDFEAIRGFLEQRKYQNAYSNLYDTKRISLSQHMEICYALENTTLPRNAAQELKDIRAIIMMLKDMRDMGKTELDGDIVKKYNNLSDEIKPLLASFIDTKPELEFAKILSGNAQINKDSSRTTENNASSIPLTPEEILLDRINQKPSDFESIRGFLGQPKYRNAYSNLYNTHRISLRQHMEICYELENPTLDRYVAQELKDIKAIIMMLKDMRDMGETELDGNIVKKYNNLSDEIKPLLASFIDTKPELEFAKILSGKAQINKDTSRTTENSVSNADKKAEVPAAPVQEPKGTEQKTHWLGGLWSVLKFIFSFIAKPFTKNQQPNTQNAAHPSVRSGDDQQGREAAPVLQPAKSENTRFRDMVRGGDKPQKAHDQGRGGVAG